jgi:hypothetical protein
MFSELVSHLNAPVLATVLQSANMFADGEEVIRPD